MRMQVMLRGDSVGNDRTPLASLVQELNVGVIS